jgi:hypothetical protein
MAGRVWVEEFFLRRNHMISSCEAQNLIPGRVRIFEQLRC